MRTHSLMQKLVKGVMVPKGLILDRVEKLAVEIFEATHETPEDVVLLCTLKGACQFFDKLTETMRMLSRYRSDAAARPVYIEEYLKASSYVGTSQTGPVQVKDDVETYKSFVGKDVIIVEDILDTGNTVRVLHEKLLAVGAATVRSVVLMSKRTEKWNGYVPTWVGFDVPDEFVLGFGCDLDQHFRDLEHLCVISDEGKRLYLNR